MNADLEQMLYRISHDLQAPLRRIQAFTGLLVRQVGDDLDERSTTFLEQLTRDAALAQSRVRALLRLSRVGRTWTEARLSSDALFEAALGRVSDLSSAHALAYRIEGSVGLIGDRDALLAALDALLDNALRYAVGSVVLGAGRTEDGRWCLRVTDDGPGVNPDIAERIFQLFASDDPATRVGLGLTVVQRVMRLHGGEAVLASGPNEGAAFELRGPAC